MALEIERDVATHVLAGQTPFLEAPERFNRELAALARRVSASSSAQ